jgi:hypothetical protein
MDPSYIAGDKNRLSTSVLRLIQPVSLHAMVLSG